MLHRPPLLVVLLLVVVLGLFAALPFAASPYAVKFATRVLVLAIFVLSLDLLIGLTGLVSFGHAAFFGLGAYAVYFVSPTEEGANPWIALGAAMALSGAAALVIGSFAVRTKGFYFIMVTLAAAQMLFALFHDTRIAGGSDGASINVKPEWIIGGTTLLDLSHRKSLYFLSLCLLVLVYLASLALARSPFGRALQGIKANETRMSALGFNVFHYKLGVFVIAGTLAGLAGGLFAAIDGFVPPELLNWRESGLAIMMAVLGGIGTLYGAIFGAVVYAFAEEILKSSSLVGSLVAEHWPIPMGLMLITVVLAAPRGLAGWLPARKAKPWVPLDEAAPERQPSPTCTLRVTDVRRVFAGLVAVDGVSLEFAPNLVHAVIGPNGAGKTTFTNVLSGALPATSGDIHLDREDITLLPAHAKARLGVGRSFQRTNIFQSFTVAENCALSAQARQPSPLRLHTDSIEERRAVDFALRATGLADRADRIASTLSHGEQRQLEIAMLIASGARILILDEPLAGTGPEETKRVMALLRDLARDHTVILIEHDMDAVFSTADTIAVLVGGRLIARGTADEIRTHAGVREAYLGNYGMAKE